MVPPLLPASSFLCHIDQFAFDGTKSGGEKRVFGTPFHFEFFKTVKIFVSNTLNNLYFLIDMLSVMNNYAHLTRYDCQI